MLARGSQTPRGSHSGRLLSGLFLLVIVLLIGASVLGARGDVPSVTTNTDASRTVTWLMNNPANLSLNGVTLGGGAASLRSVNTTVTWDRPQAFLENASSASNVGEDSAGITLLANLSNRVPDGDFRDLGGWTYTNGTGSSYRVNATWSQPAQMALLQHVSPTIETQWNSMDSKANWAFYSPNATGQVYQVGGGHDGGGMLGMNLSTTPSTGFWAAAIWNLLPNPSGNVNWSAVNRLVLWVKTNQTEPLTFNLTALVANAGTRLTTQAQPLHMDWQQIVVNLSELGSPAQRSNLSSVFLQVNGQPSIPSNTWVFFDDVRVGVAKVFTSDAQVSQLFDKDNRSTILPGSAYLSFDWCLCNQSGVSVLDPYYSLVGPSGSLGGGLSAPTQPEWIHYAQDVSPYASAAGAYTLTFGLLVAANDTAASNATLAIDNATFTFPDRQNGTYESVPIFLGQDAQALNLSWRAITTPGVTGASLSLRTGNGSSNWGAWQIWDSPGDYALSVPPGEYFQIQVGLNTSNASASPSVPLFSITVRYHALTGTVVSDRVPVQGRFVRWRVLAAQVRTSARTTVNFSIGNGSYWTPVPANGNITSYTSAELEWKASLDTRDGVQTPSLISVNVTYEFLGPVAVIDVSPGGPIELPAGGTVQFGAVALDAGRHTVPNTPFAWATTDPTGGVDNTGKYVAGEVGTWNVTATAVGLGISQTVQVRVLPGGLLMFWPYALIAALAGIGFVAYELVIRRMFAIDDVFLISKDGRLIMHNTRRMRADRDEDILSGMLTAIMSFLRDQDPEENGDLKRFEVGGKTTLLERGEHVYMTAVYSGRVPRWAGKDLRRFVADLEAKFGEAFASWSGSPEDLYDQGLKEFMQRFASHARYHGTSNWIRRAN